MTNSDVLFTEEYRPKTLDECALPERVVSELNKGITQNILLYSASPGTGKTTLTKILTKGCDTLYINGSASGIDEVREQIEKFSGTYSVFGDTGKKVVILEEMDGLTSKAFDALRAVIEYFSNNVRFIGNCNRIEKIPEPIRSRFNCIPLYALTKDENNELLVKYCKRVRVILNDLGITCEGAVIAELVRKYFPNMRSVINIIQSLKVRGITNITSDDIVSADPDGYEREEVYELFDMIIRGVDELELHKETLSKYCENVDDVMSMFASKFLDYYIEHATDVKNVTPKIGNITVAIANYCNQLATSINKKIVLLALVQTLKNIVR